MIIPQLASAGGVKALAKHFGLPSIIYSDKDDDATNQLQNQLTAEGHQKNIVSLLNLFEADSIELMLQRFDIENQMFINDDQVNLRKDLRLSDFDQLNLDKSTSLFTNDKQKGFIRLLLKLPEKDGSVDLGWLYYTIQYYFLTIILHFMLLIMPNLFVDMLNVMVLYDNKMEKTAQIYGTIAKQVLSFATKEKVSRVLVDAYDLTQYQLNNPDYEWADRHSKDYKLFLKGITTQQTKGDVYDPCFLEPVDDVDRLTHGFRENMSLLQIARTARNLLTKSRFRGITPDTQLISYDGAAFSNAQRKKDGNTCLNYLLCQNCY